MGRGSFSSSPAALPPRNMGRLPPLRWQLKLPWKATGRAHPVVIHQLWHRSIGHLVYLNSCAGVSACLVNRAVEGGGGEASRSKEEERRRGRVGSIVTERGPRWAPLHPSYPPYCRHVGFGKESDGASFPDGGSGAGYQG